jgi:hypothetical protein
VFEEPSARGWLRGEGSYLLVTVEVNVDLPIEACWGGHPGALLFGEEDVSTNARPQNGSDKNFLRKYLMTLEIEE